jgi:hypothetical protein
MEHRPNSRAETMPAEFKERLVLDRAIYTWSAPQHMTYSSKLTRFRSFINWPHTTRPTPEELSSAGFFYAGKNFGIIFVVYYYLRIDILSNTWKFFRQQGR